MLKHNHPDEATIDRSLHASLRAVAHAERLVDDLLGAQTVDRSSFDLHPAWVPAAQLLVDARTVGESLATQASVAIRVEYPAGLPSVWADTDRVAQVFMNLIGNAAKFTPAGGRIAVRATPGAHEVSFSVADTGPGVGEENRARLFVPFWQANPDHERGRGLGLSICRQIVEAHGGRIWYEDRLGPGGGFIFTLAR